MSTKKKGRCRHICWFWFSTSIASTGEEVNLAARLDVGNLELKGIGDPVQVRVMTG